mmetsp:Transcript_24495/g.68114  ORF Transcript_24495/g.68114 Transcript_24495/m.68114 type:complete len:244 (+) Transcript_24495:809-1540(+)
MSTTSCRSASSSPTVAFLSRAFAFRAFVSLVSLALFLVSFQLRSSFRREISWSSPVQLLACLSSVASSCCNVTMSFSIASTTVPKWPFFASAEPRCPSSSAAREARRKLWLSLALVFNAFAALASEDGVVVARAGASKPTCKKLAKPGWIAFPKRARASSDVRIASASVMPASSSARRPFRVDHSCAFVTQDALVVSKRPTSAFNVASVSSYACVASASIVSASAFSPSFFLSVVCINWRSAW